MNKLTLLCSALISAASLAYGAAPSLNVTVSDSSGQVAYKGKTNSAGTFATGKLAPGNYTVQFNGEPAKGQFALVIAAGKNKVMAEAVAGEKFGKGGVAMKVTAPKDSNITGQVTTGKAGSVAATGDTKVKIINGKRWFWVANAGTGSNIGGRWVEEGSAEARNVSGLSNSAVGRMQERGAPGLGGN